MLLALQRRPPIDVRKGKKNFVSVLKALIHLGKEVEDIFVDFFLPFFI